MLAVFKWMLDYLLIIECFVAQYRPVVLLIGLVPITATFLFSSYQVLLIFKFHFDSMFKKV